MYVQWVPILSPLMSAYCKVYTIQVYVIIFVSSLLQQVTGFLMVLHFTPEIKHNLKNIVESGIKHPNSNLIYWMPLIYRLEAVTHFLWSIIFAHYWTSWHMQNKEEQCVINPPWYLFSSLSIILYQRDYILFKLWMNPYLKFIKT
jgi:hypothetical protein